ncbi:phosphoglycerate mutase [Desulfocicer vacuolatum DSM 3385]|uniref:2,3-bisphosphoglycerate-independent phosphoglycerate mutase n=1 Tax=Desulfocicer vacuolatum DSM 3385 TaxID=1121400 RepID=A0A1W2DA64_9BACT|nr:2,3-bisphosphoglycerate-independent phosphoglycerate mutase [Desulfocicer vacuolatum]SMC94389.1 phosphoglycerate mutase [Desulfocicer vacuolatum DSM 3385]
MEIKKNVDALIILDGWGAWPGNEANAVALADMPFLKELETRYPTTRLACSGDAVGLPHGVMGNSEVGHMNIGAGRKVFQDLVRINRAMTDNTFFSNHGLSTAMETAKKRGKTVHLMGLLSDGGVHSHINHLFALTDMARQKGVQNLAVHAILDGRDTPPKSGITYVKQLNAHLAQTGLGHIASLCGRFYAMDRDTRWERVEKAYKLYTNAEGENFEDPVAAMEASYNGEYTDEFVRPVHIIPPGRDASQSIIRDGDSLIFFNFRADRAREITRALTEPDFTQFPREIFPAIDPFICMTQYDEHFSLETAFGPQHLDHILGEEVSRHGLKQLRIAETEKYAHVTYFFNGGDETVFPGEERILVPSPREVETYDEKPEMSARAVARKACEKIKSGNIQFMVLNFANMDMVGHTGILPAAVKACETVDTCVKKVVQEIWNSGGTAMVTADHGNAEQMLNVDGSPHTAHTLNPVKFILAGKKFQNVKLQEGILGDIAPTALKVMDLPIPKEMTGTPLFSE